MRSSGRPSSVGYPCVLIVMVLLIFGCARDSAADTVTVDCGMGGSIGATINSLPQNSVTEPHTINVSGTCNESVAILDRQRITIQGSGGATIVAPPGTPAFVINGSHAITVRSLVIQGGSLGLQVGRDSEVIVDRSTIQGNEVGAQASQQSVLLLSGSALDPMRIENNTVAAFIIQSGSHLSLQGPAGAVLVQNNQDGVAVQGGSIANLGSATITGNSGLGVFVQSGSQAGASAGQISNNGFMPAPGALQGGVFVGFSSSFVATGTTISGNTGDGIIVGREVGGNATLRLTNATVSGNTGNGVAASIGAVVGLVGSSITGNSLDGIRLTNASIAGFPEAPGPPPALAPNTISGNGGRGIFCDATSRAFGDLSGINGRRTCTN